MVINVGWSASYVDVDSVISSDVTSADMFNEELGWVARVLLSLEITTSYIPALLQSLTNVIITTSTLTTATTIQTTQQSQSPTVNHASNELFSNTNITNLVPSATEPAQSLSSQPSFPSSSPEYTIRIITDIYTPIISLMSTRPIATFELSQLAEDFHGHAVDTHSHLHHFLHSSHNIPPHSNDVSHLSNQRPRSNSFPSLASPPSCSCTVSCSDQKIFCYGSLYNRILLDTYALMHNQSVQEANTQQHVERAVDGEEDEAKDDSGPEDGSDEEWCENDYDEV